MNNWKRTAINISTPSHVRLHRTNLKMLTTYFSTVKSTVIRTTVLESNRFTILPRIISYHLWHWGVTGQLFVLKKKKREALNTLLITISFRRVRKTAKIYYLLRHVCPPAWNNSTPTGRIFIKLHIWVWSFFFPKTVKKMKFWLNSDNNKYFTWIPTYMCGIISELFLELEILQIEVVEKIKTHAMFNKFFLKIVPFVRQCE